MSLTRNFEVFEEFDTFRLSKWSDRGLLVASNYGYLRPKPKPVVKQRFNLLAFLSLAFTAALPTSATANNNNNNVQVEYPLHAPANLELRLPIASDTKNVAMGAITVIPQAGLSAVESHLSVLDALSQEAIAAVGPHGLARMQEFSRLKEGWDDGHGMPLQDVSVKAFDSFMRETGIYPPNASVFMTREGYLVLNWPNDSGQINEIEFQPERFCYFDEVSGAERYFGYGEASALSALAALPQLDHRALLSLPELDSLTIVS